MVHDVFLNDPPATIISELGPVRTLLSIGRAQRNKTTTTGEEEEEEEEVCVGPFRWFGACVSACEDSLALLKSSGAK